jgi:hypothetical protein
MGLLNGGDLSLAFGNSGRVAESQEESIQQVGRNCHGFTGLPGR